MLPLKAIVKASSTQKHMLHRATWVEINLESFKHNLQTLKNILGPGIKILAVVKADAYGHGAVPCAKAALEAGADYLGIGIIQEGIELRQSGITAPIIVLGSIFSHEVEELITHDLSTILCTQELAESISDCAGIKRKIIPVHIKVDTGMGRLGVPRENLPRLAKEVLQLKHLRLEGICTHLSSADEENPDFTKEQLNLFDTCLKNLKKKGLSLPIIHCANTSGLLRFPQSHYDMVRPGIILYGALPSLNLKPVQDDLVLEKKLSGFKPVMAWKTRIIQINSFPKGSPLSYGRTHETNRDSRIATLPLGYADGLQRCLSNKMEVLVRGKRVPQLGTICMDMCLVDVTDIPGIQAGDEVVLIGTQGDECITVENMARWSGTISYEILCTVGKRVPRIYASTA